MEKGLCELNLEKRLRNLTLFVCSLQEENYLGTINFSEVNYLNYANV